MSEPMPEVVHTSGRPMHDFMPEVIAHEHRFEFEEWSYDRDRRVLICDCGATTAASESDDTKGPADA